MQTFQTKAKKISGSEFKEVHKKALSIYQSIARKTKRRPYVRSVYFKKDKIFLALFWQHLWGKNKWQDRMRRLKYYDAGLELIQRTRLEPKSKENPNKEGEILHRFAGITKEKELFFVQIKENKNSGQKYLISIFPAG